jgi:hypothetical protein
MIGSILPDTVIEWGTDIVFLAALAAAVVYGVKRLIGFINRKKG